MAALTAPGIGSGLDINGMVGQLMALERRPLNALNSRESEFKSQLSAVGQLKSAISTFQDAMEGLSSAEKFQVFGATSSDEDVFTATADSDAGAGTFNVVVTNLAERQKLATDTAFASSSTEVGTGTLTIDVGGDSFDVTIDSDNDELTQIRDAINNATDNTGVTASIINEAGGSRLIFTSDDTGTANTITVSTSNPTGDLDQLASANLNTVQAAEDATLTVDGFNVTSSSNKVENVIEGVTLELKSEASATLDITRDTDTIKESAQGFVDAFNTLQSTLNNLRTGALDGDSTVRSIERQLRNVFNTQASGLDGGLTNLTQAGVSFDKDGNLTLDSEAFEEALDDNLSAVSELFSADEQGFAFRLDALATSLLDTDGLLDSREDGINARIDRIQDDKFRMEDRLESIEKRLRAQFSSLDSLVGSLQSTGSFLSQQLANLPGPGGN